MFPNTSLESFTTSSPLRSEKSASASGRFTGANFRFRRPAVFAIVLSVILSCIVAPVVYAQNPTPGWEDGTVEVMPTSLNLQPGKSVSYSLRLTRQPTADGWWVRVFVDGAVRADGEYDIDGDNNVDITWVPSVGWEFDQDNWDQWRTIRITATDNAVLNRPMLFNHDVWDHTGNCPVHQVGVVTVAAGGDNGDNGDPPVSVSFDRSSYEAAEGGDPAAVMVELSGDPQQTVVIPITASGQDGASSSDYSAIPSNVIFLSSETRKSFIVTAADDEIDDDGESVALSLGTLPGGFSEGSHATATVRLQDDDERGVEVSPTTLRIDETETEEYEVVLTSEPTATVTVTVGGVSGDVSLNTQTLTFTTNNWDQAQPVRVTARDDVDATTDPPVVLTHTVAGGDYAGLSADNVTVIIIEDDASTLSLENVRASEDVGDMVFTVTLSKASTSGVTVNYSTSNGTAAGSDYTSQSGTLTFPANSIASQTILVPIIDDELDEAEEESFTVTLRNPQNAILAGGGTRLSATGTIVDDDDPAVSVSLDRSSYEAAEGGAPATVMMQLSGDPERMVVIPITASEQDGASPSDYSVPSNVTFRPDETRKSFTVTATDDAVDDDDESLRLELESARMPSGVTPGSRVEATVSLHDNDDPFVSVSFDQSNYEAAEGGNVATVVVELSANPERTVTIPITTVELGDASASDYSGIPPSVTFRSGETRKSFTVTAADDAVDDDGERVLMSFERLPERVSSGSPSTGIVTIADDDARGVEVSATTLRINEGATGDYTVVLTSQPTGDVTVMVSGASGDVSVDETPLTFTTTNWHRGQTVRVRTAEDTDTDADDEVVLRHTVSGGDYGNESASDVTVIIIEDDASTLSVNDVRASENVGEMVFAVTLSKASGEVVTVDYATSASTASEGSDYTAQNGTLEFPANSRRQTIRVPIAGDAVDEENETFTVILSNPQNAALAGGGMTLAATGTIVDDDMRGVRVRPTALSMRKGGSGTYTVVLTSEPTADVMVTVSGHSGTDLSVDGTDLTFTANDWQTPQSVTATAAEEAADGLVVLRHTVSGGDYGNESASDVTVTVSSTPPPPPPPPPPPSTEAKVSSSTPPVSGPTVSVSFGAESYSVAEGESVPITVRLSAEPEREVIIRLAAIHQNRARNADYSGVPKSVTFGATETEQTFVFVASEDDEDDDGEGVAIIFKQLPDKVRAASPARAMVNILDAPSMSVSFDRADYEVTEGDSVKVTVRSSVNPKRAVKIPLTATPGMGAEESDYSGVPSSVLFAPGEMERSFSLSAVADDEADGGETVVVGFGALPGGVVASDPSTTTATLFEAVSVSFDEVREARYEASEGDEAIEFTVALSTASYREVTVEYATSAGTATAGADYEETTGTLTFPAGTTEQTFQVPILDDDVDEAAEAFAVALSAASNATIGAGEATGVIADDDLPVVEIAADGATVVEGAPATFTLRREGDVSVPLQVPVQVTQEGAFLAGETPTAAFAADEATATVVVATEDDDVDEADGLVSATIAEEATYRVGDAVTATVAVMDNDERGIMVTPMALTVVEGNTGTYTVVLDTEPTAAVTVKVEVPDGSGVSVDETELRFTAANWREAQRVAVTAAEDADAVVDDAVVLTHSVDGGDYAGVSVADVEVAITEADTAGVSVSVEALTVVEGDAGSYTVVLDTEPAGVVTVKVEVPDGSGVSVDETELRFTAANWREAQRVAVTAAEDADAVVDDAVVLTHSVDGGDYDGVSVADVEVAITEADTAGVSVSVEALTVVEGDAGSYTVVLDTEPAGVVTVKVEVPDGSGVSVDETELRFTAANWREAQRVAVTAAEDADAVVDDAVVLTHSVDGGDYAGVSVADVVVSISEADTAGVSVSVEALTVVEGDAGSYTVVLDTEPAGVVTVKVEVPVGAEVSVAPLELRFTAANWREAQRVTVTAAEDADAVVDDAVVLTHSVRGGDYAGVSVADVVVLISEADTAGVSVSVEALTVVEGDAGSYTVVLDTEPTAAVTVKVEVPDGSGVSVDETELRFTAANWREAQTVTVTAAEDADAVVDDAVVLTHSVRGGDYDGVSVADVVVSISEADTPALTITDASATEGAGAMAFTVALSTASYREVTVEYATSAGTATAGADYEETTGTLTFPAGTTEQTFPAGTTEQTFQVPILDDDVDEAAEVFAVALSAASNATIGAGEATGVIADDDLPVVEIAAAEVSVVEGAPAIFTLRRVGDVSVPLQVSLQVAQEGAFLAGETPTAAFAADEATATVVVATVDDEVDEADGSVLATIAEEATYRVGDAVTATVSVVDDDERGVQVTPTGLTVAEGDTGTYAVVLRSEPTAAVMVTVEVPVGAEVSVAPLELTFTAANWREGQMVTVTAAEDADAVVNDSVQLTHVVRGGDYAGVSAAGVEVAITEADTAGVSASVGTLTISEGTSGSYTVVLDAEPTAVVTVTVEVPVGAEVSVAPLELTFTAANWQEGQMVTVTTAEDADAVVDDAVVLTHSVDGGDYAGVSVADVVVLISEADTAGVSVSVGTLTISEGTSGSYTVVLDAEPTAVVTVTVEVPVGAEVSVAPLELTFTAANWREAQMVTVTTAEDADAVVDDAVVLTHSVDGGDYAGVSVADVVVLISEADTAGVSVSVGTLTISEGTSGSYTVVLDAEPTAVVTVTVEVPGGAEVSVAPLELTFTAANWREAQMVTVTTAEDADAVVDDAVVLTHSVDGGDYAGVSVADVVVLISEADTAGVSVSVEALTVVEGDTGSYTVVLDTEPTAVVTVTVEVPGGAEVSVAPLELRFTAANWREGQMVTMTAAEDADAVVDDAVVLTHSVDGGDYAGVSVADVEVAITEADTPGVSVSVGTLTISEGTSGSYTVVLDAEPTAVVMVTVEVPGGAEVSVAPLELRFTAANWREAQMVTVTAAEDADAVVDDAVVLTHSVDGGDYDGVSVADVVVLISEADTAGVSASVGTLTISEGTSGSYTVVLDTEPAGAVTVTVEVPVGAEVSVAPLELRFTAANWQEGQTVAVTAAEDADAVVDDAVVLTHSVDGGDYDGVSVADVEVAITEADTAGVSVSVGTLTISEGTSGSYTVVLDTEPAGAVTVEVPVEVPGGAEVSVAPLELRFTAANWQEAQMVTVTTAEDADAVVDDAVVLTHSVRGGDYAGVSVADVVVSISEADTAGVSVSVEALTVVEGDTGSYTVVLDAEPAGVVTVTVEVPGGAEVSVAPLELRFTAANWQEGQTVTVTAAEDADAVVDDAVVLTHSVRGGDYAGVSVADVVVSISEADTAGVSVSVEALTVVEGDTGSYTVVLDAEPAGVVTVPVEVPGGAEVSVAPLELRFTAANWQEGQTVTVTAAEDADAVVDDAVVLTHSVRGGDYDGVSVADVEVAISEADTAGVSVSVEALTVVEGDAGSYTVVLDTEPAGAVTVIVEVPVGAEVSVSPLELRFTAANWQEGQMVTVTAAEDADAVVDDAVVLTHSVRGGDYDGVSVADVEVAITEADTTGVSVSVEALTVVEGDAGSYTVVLDTEPAGAVTVTVEVPGGAEVSVAPLELRFTAANWQEGQTVTVTTAEDADAVVDDAVVLTHSVRGGDYDGVSVADVVVSISEDDTPALTITDASATEEVGTLAFTVALSVPSSLEVTVDWTTGDGTATAGADYEQMTGTLRFDPLETGQTITVAVLEDDLDEADETFAVALSNPTNATVADGEAIGTIADDDAAPALTIADAVADEGDRTIAFTVALGVISSLEVTVDWETSDGTAAAGEDYTASSGTLTFAPSQTERVIAVPVFNDALDESDETFAVSLSNPSNATVADGMAAGTIIDNDVSLEEAWLVRFGRSVASQMMDALSDHLTRRSGQGAHLTVGGHRVTLASVRTDGGDLGDHPAVARMPSADPYRTMAGRNVPARNASLWDALSQHPFYSLTQSSFADLLSRSSFLVSSGGGADGAGRGGYWTAWGRGETTHFQHESRDLSLSGGAVTGLLGIDRQQGRLLAGLAVTHSTGTGEFNVDTAEEAARRSELDNRLASVYPYVHFAVSERLSAWGVLGYGRGRMGPPTGRAERRIGMQMGGLSVRGELWAPERMGSFDLAVKSDAFLVKMDAVKMDATAPDRPALAVSSGRVRVALEGARPVALSSGRVLSPSLEVGMRHDGGDAETGLGLEVGGGLGYTDPDEGLALETSARRLLVHRDSGYEEWGVGGSFRLYPPGELGRGLSLRLQSSYGVVESGVDRFWVPQGVDWSQRSPAEQGGLFNAELGYGLGALGGLVTSYADVGWSDRGTRTYRLGWRLSVEPSLRVEVAGGRCEYVAARSGYEIRLRGILH